MSAKPPIRSSEMAKDEQKRVDPLAALTPLVNEMLIQTGKIFRDPALNGSKTALPASAQVKREISRINLSFHEALDVIELEILRAKAVMERDLRAIQTQRAKEKREHETQNAHASEPKIAESTIAPPQDVEMSEAPMQSGVSKYEESKNGTDAKQPSSEPQQVLFQKQKAALLLPTSSLSHTIQHVPVLPPNEHPELNMSMFNHASGPNTAHDLGYNLDNFVMNGNNPHDNIVNIHNLEGAATSTGGNATASTGPTGDISSLLPGLDTYAGDAQGDFSMINLPEAPHNEIQTNIENYVSPQQSANELRIHGPTLQNPQNTTPVTQSMGNESYNAAPSQFDDLFLGGAGDGDLGDESLGHIGDFDEGWFKTGS